VLSVTPNGELGATWAWRRACDEGSGRANEPAGALRVERGGCPVREENQYAGHEYRDTKPTDIAGLPRQWHADRGQRRSLVLCSDRGLVADRWRCVHMTHHAHIAAVTGSRRRGRAMHHENAQQGDKGTPCDCRTATHPHHSRFTLAHTRGITESGYSEPAISTGGLSGSSPLGIAVKVNASSPPSGATSTRTIEPLGMSPKSSCSLRGSSMSR